MRKIHELSVELTNQIAAGEVIERPASVVKELCENAIDAGSSRIRINFTNAGLSRITVQDNGSGISKNQLDLAFMRHATSKISTEKDLFNIGTLGFRGEALASISAVAHVVITTSDNDKGGIRALFVGGVKKNQEDAASSRGTKITVENLFYNTPARLKYLKSERTEILKIVDIVDRLALGYPAIAFTLTNSDKTILKTSGRNDLRQSVANIYGRHIAEKMLKISGKSPDFKVSGLISNPEDTRSNRNFISLLLNGRYVKNYQLTQSIIAAYGNKLRARRYPIAIIKIELDPLLVDVNVHPTKQEVRLSKEKDLEKLLIETIDTVLFQNEHEASGLVNLTSDSHVDNMDQLKFNLNKNVVNTARPINFNLDQEDNDAKVEVNEKQENFTSLTEPRNDDKYIITATWDENVNKQLELAPFDEQIKNDSSIVSESDVTLENFLPELNLVGQMNTYLLAQNKNNLYLIDKLAAQRRINFDNLYLELKNDKSIQQGLLEPIILDFSNVDYLKIKDNFDRIDSLGINLDDFGQNSLILRTYPLWIESEDVEKQIRIILDLFLNLANFNQDKLRVAIANSLTDKKKFNNKVLNDIEANELLNKLKQSSDPYQDHQGKIAIVRLSSNDLNKMFKKNE